MLDVEGVRTSIDYEPAESTTGMFGGSSNWRGPVWFPLIWLAISALERYQQFFGPKLEIDGGNDSHWCRRAAPGSVRVPTTVVINRLRQR